LCGHNLGPFHRDGFQVLDHHVHFSLDAAVAVISVPPSLCLVVRMMGKMVECAFCGIDENQENCYFDVFLVDFELNLIVDIGRMDLMVTEGVDSFYVNLTKKNVCHCFDGQLMVC